MEKIKYKFDEKEIVIWTMLFSFTSIIFILTILISDFTKINGWSLILLLILLTFMSFYWQNKFRIKRFYALCNEIENHRIDFKYEELCIKIKQKGFQLTPPMQSGDVEIEIPLYTTESYSIQTIDFVILFFPGKKFGFIKEYIKPILLKKTDVLSTEFIKKTLVTSCEYEVDILDNNLVISLKKKVSDIEKIIIPLEFKVADFFR